MTAKRLRVPYGYHHANVSLAAARRNNGSDLLHLAAYTENGAGVERVAVCGIDVEPITFASGDLCRRCADRMNVRSLDDLVRDDDEASWMEAQR